MKYFKIIALLLTIIGISNCSNIKNSIKLNVNFEETKNSRKNFDFTYSIKDNEYREILMEDVNLNMFSKMRIKQLKNAHYISLWISKELDIVNPAGNADIYADTTVLEIYKDDLTFYVVDKTIFSVTSVNNDTVIDIVNKKHNDYNFIIITTLDDEYIAEYIVNKSHTKISLKDLQNTSFYKEENGFGTDFGLTLSSTGVALQKEQKYILRVKSGIINSHKALMQYNRYGKGQTFTY